MEDLTDEAKMAMWNVEKWNREQSQFAEMKTAKKYRLKGAGLFINHFSIGVLPDEKRVLIGSIDSEKSLDYADFIMLLITEKHIVSVHEAARYAYDYLSVWHIDRILRSALDGETWPIELGLVEKIPEEPKREYMDMYEALRMVYEHGKSVAYDGENWVMHYGSISIQYSAAHTEKATLNGALSRNYHKKLWYVI